MTPMSLIALVFPLVPVSLVISMWLVRDTHRCGVMVWSLLAWTLGLGPVALFLIEPPPSNHSEAILLSPSSASIWAHRILSLSILLFVCICFFAFVSQRHWAKYSPSSRQRALLVSALALALGPILSSAFGQVPSWKFGLLYTPLLFAAVTLLPPVSPAYFASQVKIILLVYIFGSLLLLMVAPELARPHEYIAGLIPALNFRLRGLTAHPNVLAPLALAYLVFEKQWPYKGIFRWLCVGCSVVVLILTQSKTIWITGVLLYAMIHSLWISRSSRRWGFTGIILLLLSLGVGLTYWLAPAELVDDREWTALTTLTGRTAVWSESLRIWSQSKWFGYGPSIWSLEHRLTYGPHFVWVGHGHNQFFHTLGESGSFGFIGLIAYLLVLVGSAWTVFRNQVFAPFALVMLLIIRSIAETPFRNYAFDATFFMHFIAYGMLLLLRPRTPQEPRSSKEPVTDGTP